MQFGNTLIIGDSYSTFKGYIPEGYAPYYTNEPGNTDVRRVEETWWHQLQAETDCRILLNNSWSGSTICHTGYDGVDCYHCEIPEQTSRSAYKTYMADVIVGPLLQYLQAKS
jgi:hypothetical protein